MKRKLGLNYYEQNSVDALFCLQIAVRRPQRDKTHQLVKYIGLLHLLATLLNEIVPLATNQTEHLRTGSVGQIPKNFLFGKNQK